MACSAACTKALCSVSAIGRQHDDNMSRSAERHSTYAVQLKGLLPNDVLWFDEDTGLFDMSAYAVACCGNAL
jgi:hypothetical protein